MSNGFVVDAHFIDKIEEENFFGTKVPVHSTTYKTIILSRKTPTFFTIIT
jgi:hypothetical protein